ncbi:uncharacterized protein LOC123545652 [Mercenaria mercenaria]|uniref:uncharacterized protein LOC123545652 n=1 Tax=Mercenaria mercenaria TaxID=6596 RepID=UPI00234E4095|nr:uncharacterized protein LOC123545652 [Mercenaria mercenaria]
MQSGPVIITVLISMSASSARSANKKTTVYNETDGFTYDYNVTMNITKVTKNYEAFSNRESGKLYNISENMFGSEKPYPVDLIEDTDELHVTNTESWIDSDSKSDSFLNMNTLHFSDKNINNTSNEGNNNDIVTTEELPTQHTNTHEKETLFSEKVLNNNIHNVPYHTHNGDDRVQTFILERKKIQLQHHLQLVPMEDEPLGAMMFKNQRYIISVLVPIGVGMIGAAMIVCTVITLRNIARQRVMTSPLDDCDEAERPITPSVSSVSNGHYLDKVN